MLENMRTTKFSGEWPHMHETHARQTNGQNNKAWPRMPQTCLSPTQNKPAAATSCQLTLPASTTWKRQQALTCLSRWRTEYLHHGEHGEVKASHYIRAARDMADFQKGQKQQSLNHHLPPPIGQHNSGRMTSSVPSPLRWLPVFCRLALLSLSWEFWVKAFSPPPSH